MERSHFVSLDSPTRRTEASEFYSRKFECYLMTAICSTNKWFIIIFFCSHSPTPSLPYLISLLPCLYRSWRRLLQVVIQWFFYFYYALLNHNFFLLFLFISRQIDGVVHMWRDLIELKSFSSAQHFSISLNLFNLFDSFQSYFYPIFLHSLLT